MFYLLNNSCFEEENHISHSVSLFLKSIVSLTECLPTPVKIKSFFPPDVYLRKYNLFYLEKHLTPFHLALQTMVNIRIHLHTRLGESHSGLVTPRDKNHVVITPKWYHLNFKFPVTELIKRLKELFWFFCSVPLIGKNVFPLI